ncbi:hypothetical protein [Mameliella sediminis]|uniref:hypothetical protein n=1 Tax=Mameliella sediminis TaxID=2836866 RepID=UPI001C457E47|nr:hypothetical protein [Mameliella sediminis]MBV7397349.1 hypothetical protein [Mameliella sediminis]MBY6117304.1 hypothetical protein [Antarctobacter heliothermus]MBY6147152.1 hypothetical protein [Mameliella alba]MBY6172519.1 hypothetical protein [Mameliella alba]
MEPLLKHISIATLTILMASAALASPDADGPAGFTADWHGHGANHQGNNAPGDTAADRHNFGNADAGNSGKSPAAADRAGKKD